MKIIIIILLGIILCYIVHKNCIKYKDNNENFNNVSNLSTINSLGTAISNVRTNNSTLPYNLNVMGMVLANNTPIVPIGTILATNSSTITSGWLLCDGSIIVPSRYPVLSSVIGSIYGAPNKLPDLRGRNIVGTSSTKTLSSKGGAENVALDLNTIAAHSHTIDNSGRHTHAYTHGSNSADRTGGSNHATGTSYTDTGPDSHPSHTHTVNGGNGLNGTAAAHNNMMPSMALNYIIRAQ